MWSSRYSVDPSFAPIVNRPADLSRSSANAFSRSPCRFSNRRAYSRTIFPASVNNRSLADRSISFSPSSVSSLWIDSEIAGCVRSNFSAAREKLFSAETVKKTRRGCISIKFNYIMIRIYRKAKHYKFAKSSDRPHNRGRRFNMAHRVYIFDTTLRDGEQSPGCSMTVPEKLRMAAKLVELGVDILEAGFPIASEGDSEAVTAVAREYPWACVAALARANRGDILAAAKSLKNARRPRIHTFIATSDIHLRFKL